ncbi:MAG: hypothetical protein J6S21_07315, partial [Victivallales bacterium]|nr:hypothetical protein [Victivallales bacterium]
RTLVGITPEYSKGDRIIAWSVFWYVIYGFGIFLVQLILNLIPATRWSEITWFKFWLYYTLPFSLIVGVVTTIWFTWGSSRDLYRLFKALREDYEKGTADTESGQMTDEK